jgi:hypothetical protein
MSVADIRRDAGKFYTLVRDFHAAVRIASNKQRYGRNGAFHTVREGFLVCWDAKPFPEGR